MFSVLVKENIWKCISLRLQEDDLLNNNDSDFAFTKCRSLNSYFDRFQIKKVDKCRFKNGKDINRNREVIQIENLETLERKQTIFEEHIEWMSHILQNPYNLWTIHVQNFEEICSYLPYNLDHFVIFIDLDHTILKPIIGWDVEENKYGWKEDQWISDTIQPCVHQWKERGAQIVFLTHRYFDNDSLAHIEDIFQKNGIDLEKLTKHMDPLFWTEESNHAFPISSKLLNQEKEKTEHVLFSYLIRNILFSRGNWEYENKARRLYGIEEHPSVEIEKIQAVNPTLTNHKGETAKEFIEYYNHHCEKEAIQHAIVIDDDVIFVRHVLHTLNQTGFITKGFCIKWNIENASYFQMNSLLDVSIHKK